VHVTRGVSAALVLVALAACGSSSNGLSKADYISRADAICQKYNGLAAQATASLTNPTPAQVVTAVRTKLVPLFERQNEDLAKLKPPAADRATVQRFVADLTAATADIGRHTQAFVDAHGATPLATKAATEAQGYGFKVCAKLATS